MEVKSYYIEDGLAMLNMQTDYKAEEEWGVSELIKISQAGEIPCQLVTFTFDKKDIPVLVFNRNSFQPTDIEWINGGELVRKLKLEKTRFADLKKYLFPETGNPYEPFLNPEKMDKGFACNSMFLASFTHGDVLLIAPNPYVILLEEKELRKDKYRYKINRRVNKESLWKNIQERRKQQFKENVQAVKEMYQSYEKME